MKRILPFHNLLSIAVLLALAMFMSACSGTRQAYQAAEGVEDTAKVIAEHYYALVKEANNLAASGQLVGSDLLTAQSIVRRTNPVVIELSQAAQAYAAVRSAETEADLQAAINNAARAVSSLITALKGSSTSSLLEYIERDSIAYVDLREAVPRLAVPG